ncbi:MAG: HNH endonuclease domain-containing protein [Akkermansia sp.]|nr:HNH endonuclease domain-containing protein [Akkermansia sp.]
MKKLTFSFDIGHSSIGWAVLSEDGNQAGNPSVDGTGVVLFEADSCLASKRRANRRLRRTIRSRRKRIERIGAILQHYRVISEEERRQTGHPVPFFLASRVLQGREKLSGVDVWHILRWYAQNRGYDGNCRWSSQDDTCDEDIAKVEAAKAQMAQYGTSTMAETVVAILGLDTSSPKAQMKVDTPCYKSLGMAFPRGVVMEEVERILAAADVPDEVRRLILRPVQEIKAELAECGVRYPLRYDGSVLFGQLVPRLDNRIIARCPITWAKVYSQSKAEGRSEQEFKKLADKYAKVPKADCKEFYEYRFARILANLRLEGEPLPAALRRQLMEKAREVGRYTVSSFRKEFEALAGSKNHNLRNYFQITPDADKALVIVPQREDQEATGRAPYARPVLAQVVEEVLNGEDPTKPARDKKHPTGELKGHDGVLYPLSQPDSEVSRIIAAKPIEQQTNNHLVRHRMLIFSRLLRDMIKQYAGGDAANVTDCCVEVGRELKEFSGMTAKDITKALNERMRHFHSAVAHLEKNRDALPSGTRITGGLIRKCRIAMDMGWTCPYTGTKYSVKDLPSLEREHIVPHAARNTNAMAALVLTYPEINKWKGKRTALEFIRECQTQPVPGRDNLSIITEKRFKNLVDKLGTKGSPDDQRRCKARKRLLLVEHTPQTGDPEGLGFTDGMMTQSSQLMRLAAQVAKRAMPRVRVSMIPGYVTAAVRRSWNLMRALVSAAPDIVDKSGRLLDKESIRGITHLHHALDACTLGLTLHLIPAGNNGIVWQAIGKRRLNEKQLSILRVNNALTAFNVDADKCLHLKDVPSAIVDAVAVRLQEKRVVRHVPADMSGAHLEEQYRRVTEVGATDAKVRSHSDSESKTVPVGKLIGLDNRSKLKTIKAVLVVSDNYGLALDPIPRVIPHAHVYKSLMELKLLNDGKPVRVLRAGQLIQVTRHPDAKRNRVWRIASIKNNQSGIALDLQYQDSAVAASKTNSRNWINARLDMLLRSGLMVLKTDYTAHES